MEVKEFVAGKDTTNVVTLATVIVAGLRHAGFAGVDVAASMQLAEIKRLLEAEPVDYVVIRAQGATEDQLRNSIKLSEAAVAGRAGRVYVIGN